MSTDHSGRRPSVGDKPDPDGFDPDRALAEARAASDSDQPLPVPEPADTLHPQPARPEGAEVALRAGHGPVDARDSFDAHTLEDDPRFETVDDPRIPPDKQFFKIGEVASITGLKPYVLRYWESEFAWIRPSKTSSRQRLYRRQDVAMVLQIKRLRYDDHHTIAGAREVIRQTRKPERAKRGIAKPQLRPRGITPISPLATAPKPAAQLGLGFPTASRTAELARRLAEMRRAVQDLLDVVKE